MQNRTLKEKQRRYRCNASLIGPIIFLRILRHVDFEELFVRPDRNRDVPAWTALFHEQPDARFRLPNRKKNSRQFTAND
jgi:hypothetical protein